MVRAPSESVVETASAAAAEKLSLSSVSRGVAEVRIAGDREDAAADERAAGIRVRRGERQRVFTDLPHIAGAGNDVREREVVRAIPHERASIADVTRTLPVVPPLPSCNVPPVMTVLVCVFVAESTTVPAPPSVSVFAPEMAPVKKSASRRKER